MADEYAFERAIARMAEYFGGPIQKQTPAELRLNVKSALRMHRQAEAHKKTVDEIGRRQMQAQEARGFQQAWAKAFPGSTLVSPHKGLDTAYAR
jgi:hypothetical protein